MEQTILINATYPDTLKWSINSSAEISESGEDFWATNFRELLLETDDFLFSMEALNSSNAFSLQMKVLVNKKVMSCHYKKDMSY